LSIEKYKIFEHLSNQKYLLDTQLTISNLCRNKNLVKFTFIDMIDCYFVKCYFN